ncbi:5-hydroxytryptamine receptor 1A [Sceloporus undulatus]|uniref:5-hydroxytryptamine receptor 1A n=1 Tax=Sceloporus undulatus TaxID=8520 RepID=UPI001C4C8307|nr:5-hydroxytryptamine receptor 1A [Sceloporus undulatus]
MEMPNSTEAVWWSNSSSGGSSASEPAPSSLGYQLGTSVALGSLILFAAAGNGCVIAAIALERSLQTVANYLIGSLAVTDLMVSVLVLPMAALYQVLGKWTLGQATCDLFIALDVLCCTSSILHLCAIALDRFWAITDPIDYVNKRTPRRAALLISLTWLVGFLVSIPPMLGWRTPQDRSDPDACTISKDPGYTIYSTFGAFYLPLLLMLVLYGRIFRAARFRIRKTVKKTHRDKKKKDQHQHQPHPAEEEQEEDQEAVADTCLSTDANGGPNPQGPVACINGAPSAPGCPPGKSHLPLPSQSPQTHPTPLPERKSEARAAAAAAEAKRKVALARERKTVKTLGIIMGTFILCWLPFFLVALVLPLCPRCYMPAWLGAVINWLGYSNSLLNPVIYAYFNKEFQSAFKKIAKCKFCRQ